jgi:hypothetical protein
MARGSMTRSSIVAAVVVTVLLGLLMWWRDEHPRVQRTTAALTAPLGIMPRATGEVRPVPAARSVSPSSERPSELPAADAGTSTSR